jgi:hypothetical protein
MTFRSKVPSESVPAEMSFLTDISWSSLGNHILSELPAGKEATSRNIFHWEPHFYELFPGEPRGTYFIARISTRSLFSCN